MIYDEQNQNEKWQNDVAKQLNELLRHGGCLGHGDETMSAQSTPIQYPFLKALRSIVERVAAFEEIKRAKT